MSHVPPRLLSPPTPISFEGWESTTDRLQAAGWEFSCDQDFAHQMLMMAFHHRRLGLSGICRPVPLEWVDEHRGPWHRIGVPTLPVQAISSHLSFNIAFMGPAPAVAYSRFVPIDCRPAFQQVAIEDYCMFRPRVENALVIPEPSVPELLDHILKLQEPVKQRYFEEKLRKREHVDHKVAARVIHLAA